MTSRIGNSWLLAALGAVCAAALVYVDFVAPNEQAEGRDVVEMMVFQGGYGIDFFEDAAREFEKQNPDVKVKIWASPRIAENIRLRLLAGDPPDIMYPGWGVDIDRVREADLLFDVGDALGGAAHGGQGSWESMFYPGILDLQSFDGATYGIPFFYGTNVIWYNRNLFEEKGWAAPESWDEFVALCETIKQDGIAPIALQGRYIAYLGHMFMALMDRVKEPAAVDACLYLEEGCWADPAVVDVADKIQMMFREDYFQSGCLGMTHTEAQMEFLSGRAAMVPCGTWLVSEMRDAVPEGFRYGCFAMPMVEGGAGDPTRLAALPEQFYMCAGARQPDHAIAFLKFLCSPEIAYRFVRDRNALTGMPAANEQGAPESLAPVVELLAEARSFRMPSAKGNPYPSWNRVFESCLSELVERKRGTDAFGLTPEEFAQKLEAEAGNIRRKAAQGPGAP